MPIGVCVEIEIDLIICIFSTKKWLVEKISGFFLSVVLFKWFCANFCNFKSHTHTRTVQMKNADLVFESPHFDRNNLNFFCMKSKWTKSIYSTIRNLNKSWFRFTCHAKAVAAAASLTCHRKSISRSFDFNSWNRLIVWLGIFSLLVTHHRHSPVRL